MMIHVMKDSIHFDNVHHLCTKVIDLEINRFSKVEYCLGMPTSSPTGLMSLKLKWSGLNGIISTYENEAMNEADLIVDEDIFG